jgi:hypothetical protein
MNHRITQASGNAIRSLRTQQARSGRRPSAQPTARQPGSRRYDPALRTTRHDFEHGQRSRNACGESVRNHNSRPMIYSLRVRDISSERLKMVKQQHGSWPGDWSASTRHDRSKSSFSPDHFLFRSECSRSISSRDFPWKTICSVCAATSPPKMVMRDTTQTQRRMMISIAIRP